MMTGFASDGSRREFAGRTKAPGKAPGRSTCKFSPFRLAARDFPPGKLAWAVPVVFWRRLLHATGHGCSLEV
jgi:hypothetical protein